MAINFIDALIVICMIIGMAAGFRQGFIRQLIDVAAFYAAVALAAQYYAFVTAVVAPSVSLDPTTLAAICMFSIFALAWTTLHLLSYIIYPWTNLSRLAIIDHLGGASLGFVIGTAVIGVGLSLLGFILQSSWGTYQESQQVLASLVSSSRLDPYIQAVLPYFYETLRPWLPHGLPAMFR
ncbi:MAG TPA: CvpA family protein [Chloroflexota bacterium]|nr:CvpA family protein [Chloroflexota bacterium]